MTECHPFYTQQLSFTVWEIIQRKGFSNDVVDLASDDLVQSHDNDYERIWNSLNRTDMSVLAGIASGDTPPLSEEFSRNFGAGAPSTVYSSIQRLINRGMLIKESNSYKIDDPFLKRWILFRRQG